MLFSSPRFFIFLCLLLGVLAFSGSVTRKKRILAVASCIFYAAWDYRYLGLLLLISVIDYACAARIHVSNDERRRKLWLAASVVSNLGILAYFKYTNFFLENLNGLFAAGHGLPRLDILLPAGISFYTFKSMSYTIDVYRREIEPCRSHLDYTTFVTFFPELIAGPIVRASVFLPQMDRAIGLTRERLRSGLSLFLLGITKKLLVADAMGQIADPIFAAPEYYSSGTLWLAAIAYAIQIYCDFSGYSDMAIGTAKLIGYDLPENFRMPYASANITEFWRRWHITLSSWLRDYLYIPLGGNRHGAGRTYLNLALTMLLGGLWHGASWNFVLWGALHGVALAVHRLMSRSTSFTLPRLVSTPLTLLFVVLCWIPFRATSFTITWTMITRMLALPADGARFYPSPVIMAVCAVVVFHALGAWLERCEAVPALRVKAERLLAWFDAELQTGEMSGWYVRFGLGSVAGAFVVTLWVAMVFFFATLTSNPFIYFQF